MNYQIGKDIERLDARVSRLEQATLQICPLGTARTLGNNPAYPSWVAIDIVYGGEPLPIGTPSDNGFMTIKNDSPESVTFTAPGTIAVTIPPQQQGTIRKHDSAIAIAVETVRWDYFDPCYPTAPVGTLCIIQSYRTVIQPRTEYGRDAVPVGTVYKIGSDFRLRV